MFQNELQEIGMTKNEASIYEAILSIWEASVSEIAKKSNIHRRSIYDTLERLIEKWIIFPVFWLKENLYVAVEPQKLLEVIYEKEQALKKILPFLENIKNKKETKEAAFIYKWIEWYKNYMRDMTRIAEDTYFLWAKWNWMTPWVSFSLEENFKKALDSKWKKVQIIFDPRVKARKDILDTASWEYKFLPEWYETPWIVDVFWDHVVTFNSVWVWNFWETWSIFVLVNKELADSYRTWFRFIWDSCK